MSIIFRKNKHVFIINSQGGSGKDTFVRLVNTHVPAANYSSVDEIKNIAIMLGWDGGKTLKDRRFLSDLKTLSTNYNDKPYIELIYKITNFMCCSKNENLLFVHIREPKEIERTVEFCKRHNIPINTVFISNNNTKNISYGNEADDNVSDYIYDYYVDNNGTLLDLNEEAKQFLTYFNVKYNN